MSRDGRGTTQKYAVVCLAAAPMPWDTASLRGAARSTGDGLASRTVAAAAIEELAGMQFGLISTQRLHAEVAAQQHDAVQQR